MSADEEHFRKLERMYAAAPINAFFAPTLRVCEGLAEVAIRIRPDLFHSAQALHGSVYFKALDDAAFFAVNSVVTDVFVLTVSFTIYLVRPVTEGVMTAKGQLVHKTRNVMLAESELRDHQGRQVARGSGSFMRSAIPLSADIGYQ
jgi:uncharacterized protein (TIGR00369 family)